MAYWVLGDFETASACDLKRVGAWRYAEDPTTEILCFAFTAQYGGRKEYLWHPSMKTENSTLMQFALDPNAIFVAHNVSFEKTIWRTIMVPEFGFPDIPDRRWHDTMASCAMLSLPQGLDRAAMALRLPNQKDREGSTFTLGLSKPNKKTGMLNRTPEAYQRVGRYCMSDVAAEIDLLDRIGWLPLKERKVWLLYERINQRGLRIDLDFVAKAQQVVDLGSAPLRAEFAELTGGLRMGLRDKVLAWLRNHGVAIDNLQKETVADFLEEWEDAGYEDLSGDLVDDLCGDNRVPTGKGRRALQIRSLVESSSIKKLQRMADCACADGRARGLLAYHGTMPGRPAGRLLQPTNFPRGTIEVGGRRPDVDTLVAAIMTGDPQYVEMAIGPPVETVASSLRHALIADRGRVFFSGDYAKIQACIVLALAGQHDKAALMTHPTIDAYCNMAEQIYKRPVTKKEHPEERQVGKNSVLGLGFQMGAKKFWAKYCKRQGQTLEFAQGVVDVYRKEWAPLVPKLWYSLQEAAIRAVWDGGMHEAYGIEYQIEREWLTARSPAGSKIWYPFPQKTRRAMPWDPDDVRPGFSFRAVKQGQWVEIDAFGGQLTENIVMRIEADIQEASAFRLEKNGFPIVLTVYDENVCEPELADADEKAFEQLMLEVDPWVKACSIPIAVDCWQGSRYRK